MGRRIAIVEYEPGIRDNYAAQLQRLAYSVDAFAGRQQSCLTMRRSLPDLAILDIGLGEEPDGGLERCRELRAQSAALPIIFLTARDSEIDTIVGLPLGADDYVSEDVSLDQLAARVAALLRRVGLTAATTVEAQTVVDGPLQLSAERVQTHWRGNPIPLTVIEPWRLHALAGHPGHMKSREQLMHAAGIYVGRATATSHIKRIRRKFLAADSSFDAIEAVYGTGYRWLAQA
jgi:two-component system OmpR family response regulator